MYNIIVNVLYNVQHVMVLRNLFISDDYDVAWNQV